MMFADNRARNSFLYRFTAINIFGVGLLGAAFHQGWVSMIYHGDSSHITAVIGVTFLLGLVVSLWKAYGLNQMANALVDQEPTLLARIKRRAIDAIGLRMNANIQIVNHLASVLLLLGISGTMIGIILALKSTEAFSTQDQASIVLAIVLLFKGVYVKFYASLVGIMGHMWLLTNYSMLTTQSRVLLARMSEENE